jgi:hypothetical protein
MTKNSIIAAVKENKKVFIIAILIIFDYKNSLGTTKEKTFTVSNKNTNIKRLILWRIINYK